MICLYDSLENRCRVTPLTTRLKMGWRARLLEREVEKLVAVDGKTVKAQ